MAAGAGDPHGDPVAGRGDGAVPDPDLADVDLGVTVQGEDPAHRGDAARSEHVERATRDLLGRLEDQPDPSGQQPLGSLLGQEQAGAEEHAGVHVVPAGVADIGHGRAVRNALLIGHGQGVDVGTQGDDRARRGLMVTVAAADVGDQARAPGQDYRAETGGRQPQRDPARGPVLGIADFRVRMQVAAELDELGLMRGDKGFQIARQVISFHARLPPG